MKSRIKKIFRNDLLRKGLSDSSYYMIANIGSKVLGLLIIPILARAISVEDFANYDLFLIISGFLQVVVTLGIDSGIVILMAESKENHQKLSFYYVSTLLLSILFLIVLMLIINTLFLFVDKLFLLQQEFWILIGFYVFFNIITYHTFNFLRWLTKAKEAAFLNLFSYIVGAFIGIVSLHFQKEVIVYIFGLLVGGFLGSLVSLYISREYIKSFKVLSDSKELIKKIFKLSLPFVPNYMGNNLMQIADRVVILMFFGKYELGLYSVIVRLAQIPQFLVGTIIGGFLPVMYNNYKSKKGAKLIRTFFHIYLIIIPIGFIISYFLADWAVFVFAGKEYLVSAYLLPMSLVSILFINGTQGAGFGYTIAGKTHYIMYITFISVVISFIVSLIFAWWIGLAGIFLGTLIAGIVRVYLHIKYSENLYSFGYNIHYLVCISILVFIMSYINYLFTL